MKKERLVVRVTGIGICHLYPKKTKLIDPELSCWILPIPWCKKINKRTVYFFPPTLMLRISSACLLRAITWRSCNPQSTFHHPSAMHLFISAKSSRKLKHSAFQRLQQKSCFLVKTISDKKTVSTVLYTYIFFLQIRKSVLIPSLAWFYHEFSSVSLQEKIPEKKLGYHYEIENLKLFSSSYKKNDNEHLL